MLSTNKLLLHVLSCSLLINLTTLQRQAFPRRPPQEQGQDVHALALQQLGC
jgi:hypothetical protein